MSQAPDGKPIPIPSEGDFFVAVAIVGSIATGLIFAIGVGLYKLFS